MTTRAKVYQFVAECGMTGATDAEIRTAMEEEPRREVTRSITELKRDGLIEETDTHRLVANPRGCGCLVP